MVQREIQRIGNWMRRALPAQERVVVGLSGGVDSDVVCRLAVGALTSSRVTGVTFVQQHQDEVHVGAAVDLARELAITHDVIDISSIAAPLLAAMGRASLHPPLDPGDLLDMGKATNSLRTAVFSMYAERCHVVLGTANRSELLTGFYLPFGDGLCHLQPIAHLYKTEVYACARTLGTSAQVTSAAPSAGYWVGETDILDLAYWIQLGSPVWFSQSLSGIGHSCVTEIAEQLDFERLDKALAGLAHGATDSDTARFAGMDAGVVSKLRVLATEAQRTKGRWRNLGLRRRKNG